MIIITYKFDELIAKINIAIEERTINETVTLANMLIDNLCEFDNKDIVMEIKKCIMEDRHTDTNELKKFKQEGDVDL